MNFGNQYFFQRACDMTLNTEKGFVNDPEDPGGATNFGITRDTLAQWRGHPVTIDDVKNLTQKEAASIYFARYWKPLGCDTVGQLSVAAVMFDAAVLFGIGVSALFAQKSVKESGYPDVIIDGHIGDKSIAALNAVPPGEFIAKFCALCYHRIDELVEKRPASIKYKNGWEKRVSKYLSLIP